MNYIKKIIDAKFIINKTNYGRQRKDQSQKMKIDIYMISELKVIAKSTSYWIVLGEESEMLWIKEHNEKIAIEKEKLIAKKNINQKRLKTREESDFNEFDLKENEIFEKNTPVILQIAGKAEYIRDIIYNIYGENRGEKILENIVNEIKSNDEYYEFSLEAYLTVDIIIIKEYFEKLENEYNSFIEKNKASKTFDSLKNVFYEKFNSDMPLVIRIASKAENVREILYFIENNETEALFQDIYMQAIKKSENPLIYDPEKYIDVVFFQNFYNLDLNDIDIPSIINDEDSNANELELEVEVEIEDELKMFFKEKEALHLILEELLNFYQEVCFEFDSLDEKILEHSEKLDKENITYDIEEMEVLLKTRISKNFVSDSIVFFTQIAKYCKSNENFYNLIDFIILNNLFKIEKSGKEISEILTIAEKQNESEIIFTLIQVRNNLIEGKKIHEKFKKLKSKGHLTKEEINQQEEIINYYFDHAIYTLLNFLKNNNIDDVSKFKFLMFWNS